MSDGESIVIMVNTDIAKITKVVTEGRAVYHVYYDACEYFSEDGELTMRLHDYESAEDGIVLKSTYQCSSNTYTTTEGHVCGLLQDVNLSIVGEVPIIDQNMWRQVEYWVDF